MGYGSNKVTDVGAHQHGTGDAATDASDKSINKTAFAGLTLDAILGLFSPLAVDSKPVVSSARTLIDAVHNLHKAMRLPATLMYNYPLLDSQYGRHMHMKCENLCAARDVACRVWQGAIVSCYALQCGGFEQTTTLPKSVHIACTSTSSTNLFLMDIVYAATVSGLKAHVYVESEGLTTYLLYQLYCCHQAGAELHWVSTGSAVAQVEAHGTSGGDAAITNNAFLCAVLGAATCVHEVVHARESTDTVIVPAVPGVTGTALVAGTCLYAACLSKEKPLRVVTAENSQHDDVACLSAVACRGWLCDVNADADVLRVLTTWDSNGDGIICTGDITNVLKKLGCADTTAVHMTTDVSLTSFDAMLFNEYRQLEMSHESTSLVQLLSLASLKQSGLSSTLNVSASDCAGATLNLLKHGRQFASGCAVSALACACSSSFSCKNGEEIAVIVTGGHYDSRMFCDVLEEAMEARGEIMCAEITCPASPNVVPMISQVFASAKCCVTAIDYETHDNSCYVRVSFTCSGAAVHEPLRKALTEHGCAVTFTIAMHETVGDEMAPAALPMLTVSSSWTGVPAVPVTTTNAKPYVSTLKSLGDITPESVALATKRLRDSNTIVDTPIYRSAQYSQLAGCDVYVMLDNLQNTGSFKIRGSSNMLLKAIEAADASGGAVSRPAGVVACSAGNHAQGVAYTCCRLGIPCCIVVPEYAPATKLASTKRYGAEVIAQGKTFGEATAVAERICAERNWTFLHPYDAYDVMEGQGTIAHQLNTAVPDLDTVVVNVGGGGLISGIALYLKKLRACTHGKKIRVIGVQASDVSPLSTAKSAGSLRYIPSTQCTIADGINVKVPGGRHDEVLFDLVDEYVGVPENEIAATVIQALDVTGTLTEGAGCVGLAALVYGRIKTTPGEKIAFVVCGGNIDISRVCHIHDLGCRAIGTQVVVTCRGKDEPSMLSKVTDVFARTAAVVTSVDVHNNKDNLMWDETALTVKAWVPSFSAQNRILSSLVALGYETSVECRTIVPQHETAYAAYDKAVREATEARAAREQEQVAKFAEAEAARCAKRRARPAELTKLC